MKPFTLTLVLLALLLKQATAFQASQPFQQVGFGLSNRPRKALRSDITMMAKKKERRWWRTGSSG